MKKSEMYLEEINNIINSVKNEIINTLKRLGGKVNLDYYTTEYHILRYGCVQCDNDGDAVFAEYKFIELNGDDFVVSASDYYDCCSFKLNKDDINNNDVFGLLSMLEDIEQISETEGKVVG